MMNIKLVLLIASYQIYKWMVDSIDNKEDRRPKNIKNLEVRIDFIGGDHDDNEDVGDELPENFRKAPRVKLEKKKVVKFICTHCKCVSYSSFAASTLECKVHNMVRHDIDESKSNPESRMDTVTTTLNVYTNVNDVNVRRKFNAINTKNPKEGMLFREGDERMCASLFKKTLLSKEAKNVFTMEAIIGSSSLVVLCLRVSRSKQKTLPSLQVFSCLIVNSSSSGIRA